MDNCSVDVAIIGGGFAGYSAGVLLARAQRETVIVEGGAFRNARSRHAHAILGADGANPQELLSRGKEEFAHYGGVRIEGFAQSLEHNSDGSWTITTDSHVISARAVLVTTGLKDILPDVAGIEELWGTEVFHCPYCHGFEAKDKSCAVLGLPNAGFGQHISQVLRAWCPEVTLFAGDESVSPEVVRQLQAVGVDVRRDFPSEIRSVDGAIELKIDGQWQSFGTCFVAPDFQPNDALLLEAGCQAEDGWVSTDVQGATGVPALWAAGNVVSSPDQVVDAMSAAKKAAIAINVSLGFEQF